MLQRVKLKRKESSFAYHISTLRPFHLNITTFSVFINNIYGEYTLPTLHIIAPAAKLIIYSRKEDAVHNNACRNTIQ
jgi:hypothetical protein